MSEQDLVTLVQTGGVLGCLVLAVRWLADRFTSAQRELVDLLRGVIADNIKALGEVRDTMRDCHISRDKARLHAFSESHLQERP